MRRPSLSSFCRTRASTGSPTVTISLGSTSCLMESSREGITPSVLYPTSRRTSSRSIFTTVPSMRSPSLKNFSVFSTSARKSSALPMSLIATCFGPLVAAGVIRLVLRWGVLLRAHTVWVPMDMSKAARRATLQCIPRGEWAQTLSGQRRPSLSQNRLAHRGEHATAPRGTSCRPPPLPATPAPRVPPQTRVRRGLVEAFAIAGRGR